MAVNKKLTIIVLQLVNRKRHHSRGGLLCTTMLVCGHNEGLYFRMSLYPITVIIVPK